jgi:hypothetical protein
MRARLYGHGRTPSKLYKAAPSSLKLMREFCAN